MTEGIEEFALSPPGQLLQQRRQELNMSIGEVASILLLAKTQIKAIESGDHQDLASATYVIGYWRNYARLLKIDIDDSINAFKDSIDSTHQSTIRIRDNHRRAYSHQEKSRKLTAIGFLILAILCLIAIWFWQDSEISPFATWRSQPIQGADRTSVQNMESPAEPEVPAALQTGSGLSQSVLPEPNFMDRGAEMPGSIPQGSADDGLWGGIPEIEDDGISPAAVDTVLQGRDIAFMPAEERFVDPSGPGPDGSELLTIHVIENSWLDVRDYNGEKLIFRTARAGEVVRLAGPPPFAVFVENFENVRIVYLGEQVPMTPYADGEQYARFLLGKDAETEQ